MTPPSSEGPVMGARSVLVHHWHTVGHAGCIIYTPGLRERLLRAASLRGGGGASRVAPGDPAPDEGGS